jgi:hypothetical protein
MSSATVWRPSATMGVRPRLRCTIEICFCQTKGEMPIHAGSWLSLRGSRPQRSAVHLSWGAGTDLVFLLLSDDLDQDALSAPGVETRVPSFQPASKICPQRPESSRPSVTDTTASRPITWCFRWTSPLFLRLHPRHAQGGLRTGLAGAVVVVAADGLVRCLA